LEVKKSSSEINLFTPQPAQHKFIEAVFSNKYNFLTYGGAMGGGKSYVSIAILLLLCRIYPQSKWCVIRKNLPTIKRTTLETFKRLVPTNFVKHIDNNALIVTFKNDSRIMFMAEDFDNDKDFDRFKGLEVNGFLLEQIEELQQGLLDVCFIRAGRWDIPNKPKPIIIATVNPTNNWVKEKIYKPALNENLPQGWYYQRATIEDNQKLFTDEAYMSQLDQMEKLTYQRHVMGDWEAFAVDKPFAYSFDEKKHVGRCVYNPMEPVTITIDFNKDPLSACLVHNYEIGKMHVFKEYRLMNGDIFEMCTRIKTDYPDALFYVTGDATGQNRSAITKGNTNYYSVMKNELRIGSSQMKQPRYNPSVRNTRVLLNMMLQKGEMLIDPSCEWTIRDLKYVEVNDDNSISKDRSNDHKLADFLDVIRYNLWTFHKDFTRYYPESE
jgi:phage terminase large subunit